MQLSDQAEIVIVISAADIDKNKVRGDLGITYDEDVLRLMEVFTERGLYVGSVCITQYSGQESADAFKKTSGKAWNQSIRALSDPWLSQQYFLYRKR